MSLFRRIGRVLRRGAPLLGAVIPGAGVIGTTAGILGRGAGGSSRGDVLADILTAGRRAPAAQNAAMPPAFRIPGRGTMAPPVTTGFPEFPRRVASGVLDAFGVPGVGQLPPGTRVCPNTGRIVRKRRRINPNNQRALKRALRRIEMWDTQRKRVDRALRKACPTPRRRRTTK